MRPPSFPWAFSKLAASVPTVWRARRTGIDWSCHPPPVLRFKAPPPSPHHHPPCIMINLSGKGCECKQWRSLLSLFTDVVNYSAAFTYCKPRAPFVEGPSVYSKFSAYRFISPCRVCGASWETFGEWCWAPTMVLKLVEWSEKEKENQSGHKSWQKQ